MKRIEKVIAILALLYIVQSVNVPSLMWMLAGADTKESLAHAAHIAGFVSAAMKGLIGIVCAIWLFMEAKREKLTPWVWCIFGCACRVEALVIFYLYIMYSQCRAIEREGRAQNVGSVPNDY